MRTPARFTWSAGDRLDICIWLAAMALATFLVADTLTWLK